MSLQPALCEHFDYSRTELVALIAAKRLRNLHGIFARYGKGKGCGECLSAIAAILKELQVSEKMFKAVGDSGARFPELSPLETHDHSEDEDDAARFADMLNARYARIRRAFSLQIVVTSDEGPDSAANWSDIGISCSEGLFDIHVCGQGGSSPRRGHMLAVRQTEHLTIRCLDRFLMYYMTTADPFTRTAPWCDMLEGGESHLRDMIVEDKLKVGAELDELFQQLNGLRSIAIRSSCRSASDKHTSASDENKNGAGHERVLTGSSFAVEAGQLKTSLSGNWTRRKRGNLHPLGTNPAMAGTLDTDVLSSELADGKPEELSPLN